MYQNYLQYLLQNYLNFKESIVICIFVEKDCIVYKCSNLISIYKCNSSIILKGKQIFKLLNNLFKNYFTNVKK